MDSDIKKQIVKFSKPQWWHTFGGILFIVTGILLLIQIMTAPATSRAFGAGLQLDIIAFVLGIILLVRTFIIKLKVIETLDIIENMGRESMLQDDFLNGIKLYSESIILGENYIIGKGMGTIITYKDIQKVTVKIYKRHFSELFRQLKVVNESGTSLTVCIVLAFPNNGIETDQIFDIMTSRNPGIEHRIK